VSNVLASKTLTSPRKNVEASAAKSHGTPTVQRDLTEDQKKSWEQLDGPKHVAALKQAVNGWKEFRKKPEAYQSIPRAESAPGALAELLRSADSDYRPYAAEQIGSEGVKYLSEMTGFMPECKLLVGIIPGVAWVDPAHKYVMKSNADSVINKVPMLPVGSYLVEYSNAYGWHWEKELAGAQLQWKTGLSYERGKGKGWKGAGLLPQPASISINTEATATSVGYWGYKDLAGVIKVANGPSIKVTFHGVGLKAASGGIISLSGSGGGPPGSLDFMNLVNDLKIKPSGPSKPKDLKKNVELSFTLVDAGGGVLIGGGQQVGIPELEPRPVMEEKVWNYMLAGFETGSPELPIPEGEIHPILNLIKTDVADKQKNVESITPYLKQSGIEQEFKLDFHCAGYASRRWAGARSDEERQAKNLQLSTERAQNVTSAIREAFGDKHRYSFEGTGSAVWLPGGAHGEVVPEADQETINVKVKQREEQLRARYLGTFTDDQIAEMVKEYRRGLEQLNTPTSNIMLARRVRINVMWRGYNITWGANQSPALKPVD